MQLTPNPDWQTQARGTDDAEYQVYVAAVQSLGLPVKTYEDWLIS